MIATVLFWCVPILALAYAPTEGCLIYLVATVMAAFDNNQGDA